MAEKKFEVPADRPEVIVRTSFDAPPERVFRALTDPKMIPMWWGPRRMTTIVDKMDVRKGGGWRFVHRDPEGKEFAFHGEFREVKAPRSLAYTFEWEGMPGHVSEETVSLEKCGGKTEETERIVFRTLEDRDGMVKMGMEEGESESLDRLAELVSKK